MNSMITIRASSLGSLFDCPARWAATHIDGKRTPSSGAAVLGTAIHASTAMFDQSVIDGTGLSINDTAAAAVDAIYKPSDDVDWDGDLPQDAEKIALALHSKYCTVIAPTKEYLGVEVKCERLEIADLGIALTGTTDRIIKSDQGLGIGDVKSGKSAVSKDGTVKTAGHAFQMGVYELLAEQASGLLITAPAEIIGLNTAKTADSQRVGIGTISGTRDVLLGDGQSLGVLEHASRIIHSGSYFGNPKSMMCGKKYCAAFETCKFRRG
jgi:RecB family exonuclease